MPWETIVVPLIILIASVAIWVLFWRARARRKVSSSTEYKPEYKPNAEWEEYASFKDGLKFEGMQPQKTIQYGKTRFAYDEAEEKNIYPDRQTAAGNGTALFEYRFL